jgi:diguanylate cyclase (GGDEF)-like protein
MKILNGKNLYVTIGMASLILLLVGGRFFYTLSIKNTQRKAEEKITATIENMAYLSQDLKKDMEVLDDLLSIGKLNDSQLGRLYERKSYVAYLDGNMIDYYDYIAKALFYLDQAGDYETACQVYTNLASYFFDLGNYSVSGVLMEKALNLGEISGYSNKETALLAYRMYAKLLNREELPEEASLYVDLAKDELDKIDPDNANLEIYRLMTEGDEAKTEILLGKYDKAYDFLEKYKDDPYITGADVSAYYAANFTLPYYEIKTIVSLNEGKYDEAVASLKKYIENCDRFAFANDKIDLIENVLSKIPDGTAGSPGSEQYEEKNALKNELVEENNDFRKKIITEHSEVLLSQLENKIQSFEDARIAVKRRYRTALVSFIIIMVFAAIAAIGRLMYVEGNTDALTGLRNRRAFDAKIHKLNMAGKTYGAIMIDIDKFKNFNDNYGHDFGDLVLSKIAGIVKLTESKTIKTYRYGGEEMIVVIETDSLNTMVFTAEHIRKAVERCVLPRDAKVTVSTGVGIKGQSEDPVKEADENLYFAKHNGRNATGYLTPEGRKLAQS